MDCRSHNQESAGPSLLELVDAQGGDLGATLLRLAHRAAAAHRYETATSEMREKQAGPAPSLRHSAMSQKAGGQS